MELSKQQTSIVLTINSGMIAVISIVLTILTMLWNAFYGYGRLAEKIDVMQATITKMDSRIDQLDEKMEKGFDKLEQKIDNLESEFHKIDVRVATIEQRKPFEMNKP